MGEFLQYRPELFPTRLRQERERRGMSLRTIGELCGTSKNTIRRYESGERSPNAETLCHLAEAFGTSVEYLLGANKD